MTENGVAVLFVLFVVFLFGWGLSGATTGEILTKENQNLKLFLTTQSCKLDNGVFNKKFNTCVVNGDVTYDVNSIYKFFDKDEGEKNDR